MEQNGDRTVKSSIFTEKSDSFSAIKKVFVRKKKSSIKD